MNNGLTYLLEANIYLTATYGAYWLLLHKQTFYKANRVYLLLSIAVSFTIPLVQLELPADSSASTFDAARQSYQTTTFINPITAPANIEPVLTANKALGAIFMAGVVVLFVLLFLKLYSLLKLIITNQRQQYSGYTLVLIPNLPSPFSFLGYLFVPDKQDLTPAVLQHELVHIRQKHSWDILFLELAKMICWFNPVIYLLQNSLKTLHEYEADFISTDQGINPDEYVQALIAKAYQASGLPFANHFSNKQLLKSRIMKLYQKRSGKLARLTYLITLPLCAGMLCASTMAFSKNYGLLKLNFDTQSTPKNNLLSLAADKQPGKKQRLKITSGSMTSVTDKLEIRGYNGKPLIFTAANLTTKNKTMLADWGMIVEATDAQATTTSLVLPPPPPPIQGTPANTSKRRKIHPILPPPPPPSALPDRSAKTNIIEIPLENQPDTVDKSQFSEMFKRVGRTTRYPTVAKDKGVTGMVVATFRINQDKKVSDVKIKKGISPELDAETARSISAFEGMLTVNPGVYSLGVNFDIDNGEGIKTKKQVVELEMPTAGIVTIIGYGDKKK